MWTRTAALFVALGMAIAIQGAMAAGGRQNAARVTMDSFKSLYFKDGTKTYSRRGEKMPQLKCLGSSKHICQTYAPDIVLCQHLGDGAWKCEADLHHSVRFGRTDVSCEGWDRPGDKYVLRGSCMLEYTLLPSYPEPVHGHKSFSNWRVPKGINWEPIVFYLIIAAVFIYFWRKGRAQQEEAQRRQGTGRGGGGGGGGGGGRPTDPPPPYRPYPKQEPGSTPTDSTAQSSSWRPGFWTGLAGGALASEAARVLGGRNNDRAFQRERDQQGFFARTPYYQNDDSDSFVGRDLFGRDGGGGGNAFGAAGPSGSRRSESPGETRRAYGYGGSNVR